MKYTTPTSLMNFFLILSTMMMASIMTVHGATRGNTSHRSLSSTQYSNLQLCASPNTDADNEKYFWLSLVDGNKNVHGACLLTVPKGTTSEQCCTISGSTKYSTNYNLVVSDPVTVTDTSSQAYQYCGKDGGSGCSSYNYKNNQQGFGQFHVRKQNGDGLRNPDKYVNGGAKCGLTDKLGTCHSGAKNVFGHIHFGKGYCLEGAITLSKYCNGHFAYKCLDKDC